MSNSQHICQVAFSCLDAKALKNWYQQGFGFVDAGDTVFGGKSTTRVQGLPGVWERCRWLVDSQDYFQLEFFQFWRPKSKPRPFDWSPADIGYNMLGLWVVDFDACVARLQTLGASPTEVQGELGQRTTCVKDPEGNWVEILERDPCSWAPEPVRPEIPVTVRRLTVSVPDLDRAQAAWVGGLGLDMLNEKHDYKNERTALWGLRDATCERAQLHGQNFIIELFSYIDPEPRPWPEGYRICDQGFMNVAIGFKQSADFEQRLEHSKNHNYHPNGEPLDIAVFRVMYVNDSDGFSVELLHARPAFWSLSGFTPSVAYLELEQWIHAPKERVWSTISNHSRMGEWMPYRGTLIKAGKDDENGVAAIRRLTGLGLPIVEEITDFNPEESYGYRLTSGAPIKNHRGDMLLKDEGRGTRVRWAIQFQSSIPLLAPILKWGMKLMFRSSLKNLKNQLEAAEGQKLVKGWGSYYQHKTVFVSGGSSGIGLAVAKQLAANGADVVIFARNLDSLCDAKEAIENTVLNQTQLVESYAVDVCDYKELTQKLDEAVDKLGVPDLIITSAGVSSAQLFTEQSYEDFKVNMDVNVLGTVGFVRQLYPRMVARGGGQVAMIGSLAGLIPTWGYSAYCTSKGALQSFADVLEMEGRNDGIYVSLVNPPEVDTPMIAAETASQSVPRPTRLMKGLLGTADVDEMAQSTLKSIAKKHRRITFGVRAKLMLVLNRYLPFLVRHSVRLLLKVAH